SGPPGTHPPVIEARASLRAAMLSRRIRCRVAPIRPLVDSELTLFLSAPDAPAMAPPALTARPAHAGKVGRYGFKGSRLPIEEIDEHLREIAGLADRIVVPRGRPRPSEEQRPRMLPIAGQQHGGDVAVPVEFA